MLRFFRRIRQRLLLQGKLRTYVKYALGEIALVMIGILLALQVNNWNEKRKLNDNIERIFIVLESELKANIDECAPIIEYGYFIDSVMMRYVANEVTREDILSNPDLFLRFSTATRFYTTGNLDEIIAMERELPEKYAELIPEIKLLKSRILSQRKWEQAAVDLSVERGKELVGELPTLYLTDSVSIDEMIRYSLNDPIVKNKFVYYTDFNLNENVWDMSLIRTSAVALLWKIKNLRKEVHTPVEEFLESLELQPFQVQACDALPVQGEQAASFRLNYILYNNLNEEVFYNVVDTSGAVLNRRVISLAPKSFNLREVALSENQLIQVMKADTCETLYRRLKQDYAIFN